jgi:hypothetical protein
MRVIVIFYGAGCRFLPAVNGDGSFIFGGVCERFGIG